MAAVLALLSSLLRGSAEFAGGLLTHPAPSRDGCRRVEPARRSRPGRRRPSDRGIPGRGTARALLIAALAGLSFGLMYVGLARGAAIDTVMTMVGSRTTSCLLFGAVDVTLRTTAIPAKDRIAVI